MRERERERERERFERGRDLTSGGCQRGMFRVADGVMSECFGSLGLP